VATLIGFISLTLAVALPASYKSTVVIFPSPESISVWTETNQNAPGTSATSLASSPAITSPLLFSLAGTPESAAAILQSRSVSDAIIGRFGLTSVYGCRTLSAAERKLTSHLRIDASPVGTVSIEVTDHSPERAAAMAKAFVEEFDRRSGDLAHTLAVQRFAFYQHNLISEMSVLATSEAHLKAIQETEHLLNPALQIGSSLQAITELRSTLSTMEMEQHSLETTAGDKNSAAVTLKSQLESIRGQLNKLAMADSTQIWTPTIPNTLVSPTASLEFTRAYREVLFHGRLADLLSRQLESASLDQTKRASAARVIQPATIPDAEIGPPRITIAFAGILLGVLFGIGQSFIRQGARVRRIGYAAANLP